MPLLPSKVLTAITMLKERLRWWCWLKDEEGRGVMKTVRRRGLAFFMDKSHRVFLFSIRTITHSNRLNLKHVAETVQSGGLILAVGPRAVVAIYIVAVIIGHIALVQGSRRRRPFGRPFGRQGQPLKVTTTALSTSAWFFRRSLTISATVSHRDWDSHRQSAYKSPLFPSSFILTHPTDPRTL